MTLKFLENNPPWDWPENADQIILKVLQNPSATSEDRLLAAEMAGDSVVVNKALIDALLEIINSADEAEEFRSVCTMALGPVLELLDIDELDDDQQLHDCAMLIPTILQPLHFDENAPDLLRRRALEASVRYEQEWHTGAITTAFNSDQIPWRRTAVFAMRFVPGFENQIMEALESDDEDTEFQAVCAADVWSIEAAWHHVLNLVCAADTEKFLRMAAIDAMASIRPHETAGVLLELDEFEDDDLVNQVHEVVAMVGED